MNKPRKGGVSRFSKTPTRERTWEAKSDTSEGHVASGPPHQHHHEPTYKIYPDDDKKFRPSKVEEVMHGVLKEYLSDVEYDNILGQRMSKMLADTIKTRLKDFKWMRYKLVVYVVIGENREQNILAGSRFLWSTETDTYASTKFVSKSIFALAICYGIYYD